MDNYEEKYKKALEAVKFLQEVNPYDEGIQNWVKDNFPELKETEEEKMRKWCISHFKECINVIKDNDEYKEYLNNIIHWLEKIVVKDN